MKYKYSIGPLNEATGEAMVTYTPAVQTLPSVDLLVHFGAAYGTQKAGVIVGANAPYVHWVSLDQSILPSTPTARPFVVDTSQQPPAKESA